MVLFLICFFLQPGLPADFINKDDISDELLEKATLYRCAQMNREMMSFTTPYEKALGCKSDSENDEKQN